MTGGDVQKIECDITFLPKSDEGWGRKSAPILTGNTYRPHFVAGDPSQRQPILTTRTHEVERPDGSKAWVTTDRWIGEEYAGVCFGDGPENIELGRLFRIVVTLMFWPHLQYEKFEPGATFTVREGGTIVGFGRVLRWL